MAPDRRSALAAGICGSQAGRQGLIPAQSRGIRRAARCPSRSDVRPQDRRMPSSPAERLPKEFRRTDMTDMRKETDSLGVVEVPADKLWGAQTQRSLEHFSI